MTTRFTRTDVFGGCLLLGITAIGAWLRFVHLGAKPLHFDEGVNGATILQMLDEHTYAYKPHKHHGPLLFFLNAVSVAFGGRTVEALRFMPALFGTLAIPSILLFRRQLGWAGVCTAAAFVAVAPIEVYFSRTAIHEIYNFFFNFVLVGAAFAWSVGHKPRYLLLASASLACLFATKETTVLTVAALVPALAVTLVYGPTGRLPVGSVQRSLRALVVRERRALLQACVLFVAIWAVLFSSFFTDMGGLWAFFEAFFRWGETGAEPGHQKVWDWFFRDILWPYYRPVVVLGAVGLVWGALERDRLALFCLVWFLFAAAAYAVIPYKTPWCVLSFSGPLFLGVGLLGDRTWGALARVRFGRPLAAGAASVVLAGWALPAAAPLDPWARTVAPHGDTWTINLEEYDVEGHPFVYAQTVREYLHLIHDLEGLVATASRVGVTPRAVFVDLKYPIRYYLPGLVRMGSQNTLEAARRAQDIDILCLPTEQAPQVEALLEEGFTRRRYHERPGHRIDMFVRDSLWTSFVEAGAAGQVAGPSPGLSKVTFSRERTRAMQE